MSAWSRDFGYSLRRLSRSPGFSFAAIGLLGLALAANICVFAILYPLLYKPMPYRDADRLVSIVPHLVKENLNSMLDPGHIRDFSHLPDVFDRYGGFARNVTQLENGSGTEPTRLELMFLEPVVADLLGMQPLAGRLPATQDVGVHDPGRVWVSAEFATEHFGSAERALTAILPLRLGRYQIAGVLRPNSLFSYTQLWIPVAYTSEALAASADLRYGNAIALGRLVPGMSREEAGRRLTAMMGTIAHVDEQPMLADLRLDAASVRTLWSDPNTILVLQLLMATALMILLITVFNVSNLFLARLAARRHESALIAALGATAGRQLRLHGMDAAILSGGALALALLLAPSGLILLGHFDLLPGSSPYPIRVDPMSVAIAGGLAFTILLSLLGSALWMQRRSTPIQDVLKESGNRQSGGRALRLVRIGLTVSQVALTITLLVGAGLLIRSAQRLLHEDMGFDRNHLIMSGVSLDAGLATYVLVEQRLLERAARIPGVLDATLAACNPVNNGPQVVTYEATGNAESDVARWPRTNYCPETDYNYFAVMGTHIVAGRPFSRDEVRSHAAVAIVDQRFVKRNFPDGTALGRSITLNMPTDFLNDGNASRNTLRRVTIVGVVENMKSIASFVGFDENLALYLPGQQGGELLIRTSLDLLSLQHSLKTVLHEISPAALLGYTTPVDGQITGFVHYRYPLNDLLRLLSVVALVLASVGLYAVLAYSVRMRSREFGVRLALGEDAAGLRRGVVLQGLRWAGMGALLSIPLVWLLSRVLASQLYRVAPLDPLTLAAVLVIVGMVAFLASWWPARLASRIDPLSVLRAE